MAHVCRSGGHAAHHLSVIPGPFLFIELMGLLLGFWELSPCGPEDLLRTVWKMSPWLLGVFRDDICPHQSSEKLWGESVLSLSPSLRPSFPPLPPSPPLRATSYFTEFADPWGSLGMLEKTSGCYGFLGGRHGGRSKELSFSWGGRFFANTGDWSSLPHLRELS